MSVSRSKKINESTQELEETIDYPPPTEEFEYLPTNQSLQKQLAANVEGGEEEFEVALFDGSLATFPTDLVAAESPTYTQTSTTSHTRSNSKKGKSPTRSLSSGFSHQKRKKKMALQTAIMKHIDATNRQMSTVDLTKCALQKLKIQKMQRDQQVRQIAKYLASVEKGQQLLYQQSGAYYYTNVNNNSKEMNEEATPLTPNTKQPSSIPRNWFSPGQTSVDTNVAVDETGLTTADRGSDFTRLPPLWTAPARNGPLGWGDDSGSDFWEEDLPLRALTPQPTKGDYFPSNRLELEERPPSVTPSLKPSREGSVRNGPGLEVEMRIHALKKLDKESNNSRTSSPSLRLNPLKRFDDSSTENSFGLQSPVLHQQQPQSISPTFGGFVSLGGVSSLSASRAQSPSSVFSMDATSTNHNNLSPFFGNVNRPDSADSSFVSSVASAQQVYAQLEVLNETGHLNGHVGGLTFNMRNISGIQNAEDLEQWELQIRDAISTAEYEERRKMAERKYLLTEVLMVANRINDLKPKHVEWLITELNGRTYDTDFVKFTIYTIHVLSTKKSNRNMFFLRGCIGGILAGLRRHPVDHRLHFRSVQLLKLLGSTNPIGVQVERGGGVPLLLNMLKAYQHTDIPLITTTCSVISVICKNRDVKHATVKGNGVNLLLTTLSNHQDKPDVTTAVTEALQSLCAAGPDERGVTDARKQVAEMGGLSMIVTNMRQYMTYCTLLASSLSCLVSLSGQNTMIRNALVEADAISVILDTLMEFPRNLQIVSRGVELLSILICSTDVALYIQQNKAQEILVTLINNLPDDNPRREKIALRGRQCLDTFDRLERLGVAKRYRKQNGLLPSTDVIVECCLQNSPPLTTGHADFLTLTKLIQMPRAMPLEQITDNIRYKMGMPKGCPIGIGIWTTLRKSGLPTEFTDVALPHELQSSVGDQSGVFSVWTDAESTNTGEIGELPPFVADVTELERGEILKLFFLVHHKCVVANESIALLCWDNTTEEEEEEEETSEGESN